MDLSTFISLGRPNSIQISYKGCDEIRKRCEAKIIPYFEQNTTAWKRQGRQFPFPLHVRFSLRFSPFDRQLVMNAAHKGWEKIAFLHIFFMKPSSVEEYRTSTRNEVSEWFALVSQAEGAEWLIIFDSTKAREMKNRGALMERIKSDFAKFTSRILEIHEGSAQCTSGMQLLIQTHLLTALECYVSAEEARLSACKEDYKKLDFNFITYCEDQMVISRLYHSLGVLEHVLAKFDELDALLSLIIGFFSTEIARPKWILESDARIGDGCPLLTTMARLETPRESMTPVEMRCLILAHQIMISLRIYDERIRHATENSPSNELQMKSDFAAILLRYANHCISAVCENIAALKLNVNREEIQCWTIAFCIEAMQFVGLLTEAAHIEHAAYFLCSLALRKCNAIADLYQHQKGTRSNRLLQWLEKGAETFGDPFHSNAVIELRQILSNAQQFTHFMQKYHESSIALLKHFGWKRQSKLLGYQLANFLLASDRVEGALPYLLKFVSGLFRDGSSLLILQKTLLLVVKHLEVASDLYFKELIEFYLILSTRVGTEKEQTVFCKKLLKLFGHNSSGKIRRYSNELPGCVPVRVCTDIALPRIIATPGDLVHTNITVFNDLPLPIEKYSVRCVFKRVLSSSVVGRHNAGYRPRFECSFHSIDGISRFGCTSKGDFMFPAKDAIDKSDAHSNVDSDEAQETFAFQLASRQADKLHRGSTQLQLVARVCDVGVYLLDYIEVEIMDSLCLYFSWADIPEIEGDASRRPVCFIHRKAPVVDLKPLSGKFVFAGVAQCLDLELCSGSEPVGDSHSTVYITTVNNSDSVEFWNASESKWASCCELIIDRMVANEKRSLAVYVCFFLRDLIEQSKGEENHDFVQDISVKWQNNEWTFTIIFRTVINVDTKVSLLEDRVLFEMKLSRPQNDGWLMIPQEAILLAVGSEPQVPAKLLNPKLTEIRPLSTFRIVWVLNSGKNESTTPQLHTLKLLYRVKRTEQLFSEVPEEVFDREYTYEDSIPIAKQKASYELCAQLLSSQPGAVLCRIDSACDLIVSLRSLTNRVETVVIGVDSDARFWTINEKHKLLFIKESGLGQTSFSVVPKMVGFLPYPSVSVFCCHHQRSNSDKSTSSRHEQSDFGPLLPSFIRTSGKQVHVLGAFNPFSEQKHSSNEKSGRLKEAKTRLTKLFD